MPKLKFNIGDIVIGNAEAAKHYCVTTTGWIGEVVSLDPEAKEDDVRLEGREGCTGGFWVCSKYFDLKTAAPKADAKTKKKIRGPKPGACKMNNREAFELVFGFLPHENSCPAANCNECPYSSDNDGNCNHSDKFWTSPYEGQFIPSAPLAIRHKKKTERGHIPTNSELDKVCAAYNSEGDAAGLMCFKEQELWTTEEQYNNLTILLLMNELIYTHNSEKVEEVAYQIQLVSFLASVGIGIDSEGFAFVRKDMDKKKK